MLRRGRLLLTSARERPVLRVAVRRRAAAGDEALPSAPGCQRRRIRRPDRGSDRRRDPRDGSLDRRRLSRRTPDGEGRLVGHLLLSEGDLVAIDASVRRIWMVGPIAVPPATQGRGNRLGFDAMRPIGAGQGARTADFWSRCWVTRITTRGLACRAGAGDRHRPRPEEARSSGIDQPNWMALRLPGSTPGCAERSRFPAAFGTAQPSS